MTEVVLEKEKKIEFGLNKKLPKILILMAIPEKILSMN